MGDIILMYGVFILYFLVPLIPAVVIYKAFPNTRAFASGPLQGLNIKVSGAFAAYVIALVSGIFIVTDTIEVIKIHIKNRKEQVDYLWTVSAKFKVLSDSGRVLSRQEVQEVINRMQFFLDPQPRWHRNSDDEFLIFLPNNLLNQQVTIAYSSEQCEVKTLLASRAKSMDIENKLIDMGVIEIRKSSLSTSTYDLSKVLQPGKPK